MDIAHFVFVHSSVDGHFDCFYFLAIINSATMNIHVQVFMWTYVSISLGYIPRSRIAVSCGNSVFNILRNCQTVFQSSSKHHFTFPPAVNESNLFILMPNSH